MAFKSQYSSMQVQDEPTVTKKYKKTITSAQVLAMNTTPVQLVPAPGAGLIIDPISTSAKVDFNSAPYATNTDLDIQHATATKPINKMTGFLASSVKAVGQFREIIVYGASDTIMIANKQLEATVPVGDPITGDSDIIVYGTYRIIEE